MRDKNKCEYGRYKSESYELCIYCDPNQEKGTVLTCSLCDITGPTRKFYSETVCKSCEIKLRKRGKRVCKYCGFIGKAIEFQTRFRCVKCFKEKTAGNTRRNRESLKGKMLTCRRCGLTKDGSKFESRFICRDCVNKRKREDFNKIDTDLTCERCGFVGKVNFFRSRNLCRDCSNEDLTKKRRKKQGKK